MALVSLVGVVVLFLVALLYKYVYSRRANQLPTGVQKLPGPKGLPVIGSIHELSDDCPWMKFHEWGQEYGPIYQVNLGGSNHIWISSDEVAHDLLSKRGAIYSDRPHIPALIADNRTSAQYLPLLSKNDAWARQRKFAKQIMSESEKASLYDYPEIESKRMLVELLDDPAKYNHALESFIARVTCRLAWGTSEPSDELKQRARELLIGVSPTGALGNKLPFLMSLPSWLVPAKAWEVRRAATERRFFEIMQGDVQKQIDEKRAPRSWMRTFLDNPASWGFKNHLEGAYAVGMHGIAGALTIAAPMQSFCMAMCHYPQYQPLLQEELDRVCGDRMPTSSDAPNLPVLRAFIREAMRWRPPVPTGIPHEVTQDDVYNGYHIPANSVLHPLEWSISRDPHMFPDPNAFNPTRWLNPEYPTYKEPLTQFPTITQYSQFGYGRRTCQGQVIVDADLLVGIGSIAWLFNLSKDSSEDEEEQAEEPYFDEKARPPTPTTPQLEAADPDRNVIPGTFPYFQEPQLPTAPPKKEFVPGVPGKDPTLDFTELLIAKPKPFKFKMEVRRPDRAEYVRKAFQEGAEKGDYPGARSFWRDDDPEKLGWGKV